MPTPAWLKEARAKTGRAWLARYGWTIDGGAPRVAKAVICAAPHTTNWDLPFTLAICWALGIELAWIGKDSLFKGPAGPFIVSSLKSLHLLNPFTPTPPGSPPAATPVRRV